MLRALTLRLPFVLTFHGGGHSSKVRSAARPAQLVALRPLLARAARLVAVARFEIEAYSRILRLPHDRFTYIPNGVDFVSDGGTTDDGTLSGPLLASIGRLERYKGHDRVIDALPEVLAREPTATLVIVGNGPYESALRDQVVRRGLADYVHFTSVPSNDAQAMQTLLARVSLVVLMSSFETHPLVGLEAAAARRRLLVADHAGLGELVRDGLAEGVPITASSSDLAAAILRQLDQPAPSASPSLTSWDDCALNLLALYRAVLDRSPPPQSSRS
jgi:glycosyltransferase involved in cell wall biosynthesis